MRKISIFLISISLSFQSFSQVQSLPLSGFNGIDAFGPFNIELIKSEVEKVEIDYKSFVAEDVVKEMKGGVLKLKLKNRHFFDEWDHDYSRSQFIRVKIYYSDLDIIKGQAGAIISSNQLVKSKYLTIESTMGAEISLDILVKELETKSSMGGLLTLSGQAERLTASANMGGILKASDLESKFVYVKASMGAEVLVNALNELDANATFGATIDYVGGPAVRYTNKVMGGEVHRRSN
jgi:hypothetical protein